MSHTTVIKTVPITDMEAVRSAVAELKENGVNIELVEKSKPRMYYDNQHGISDYVLNLKDGKYDIGLDAAKDENGNTVYNMVYDVFGGHVKKILGATNLAEGASQGAMNIGMFTQLYTKHAAINQCAEQGYNLRSCEIDAKGNLQLLLASY